MKKAKKSNVKKIPRPHTPTSNAPKTHASDIDNFDLYSMIMERHGKREVTKIIREVETAAVILMMVRRAKLPPVQRFVEAMEAIKTIEQTMPQTEAA